MRLSGRCSAASDFGIGAIDSSLPQNCWSIRCAKIASWRCCTRDDPLAAQAHLPWKQLVGRDIAVFSKGNIQRLVAALVESHRLTLTTRYGGLYRNPVWSGALALSVAILPALYHPSAGPGAQGRPPAAAALAHSGLMRGPQALPPLLKTVFPCCRPPCARAGA